MSAFVSPAQEPYSIRLSGEKGLPIDAVYDILQDKKGFIWITGNDGIMRYDGFTTTTYRSENQTSAPGSCLKEDSFGRIWYENFDGYIYYVLNDSLYKIEQHDPIGFLPFGITDSLLLCFQKDGIDIFSLTDLKLKKTIQLKLQVPGYAVGDGKNYYFIANNNHLYCINEKLQFRECTYPLDELENVKQIYTNEKEVYVVSKTNKTGTAFIFDKQLSFQRKVNISDIKFIQGSAYINNQYWFYTPHGAYVYNGSENSLANTYFSSLSISKVFKDRWQNYWIATTNNGLYLVPDIENKIFPTKEHIPSRIEQTPSGTMIGCKDGTIALLDSLFTFSKEVSSTKDKMEISYLHYDTLSQNLFYTSSKGFVLQENGTIVTLNNINISLKEVKRLDDKYYAIAVSGFCGLLLNPASDVNSVSDWDSLFKSGTLLPSAYLQIVKLKDNLRAKSVDYCEAKKEICFATNLGLFKYTANGLQEIRNNAKPFFAEKVVYTEKNIIALDSKGNIFKIHETNQFENLNKKLGIEAFLIKKMKKCGNRLYLITLQSIYDYEPKQNLLKKIHLGINPQSVNDIAEKNNQILLLTNEGIVKIPFTIQNKQKPVTFTINSITANGIKKQAGELKDLSHKENEIEINYSILNYGAMETPDLYYNLNESDWEKLATESRTVKFSALSPGEYTIKFKMQGRESGIVHFSIRFPLWKTWWFNVFVGFVVIGLLFLYFKRRTNIMNKQIILLNEKIILEKNLNKTMLTAIKSQMNPHFFYNALNTIQAYIFTNDKAKANTYLAKFSKLTRIILEMSEKETISLSEEADALRLYLELEKMRFSENFKYSISYDGISNKEVIEFPPMLIQPVVENAVKHGLLHKKGEKYISVLFVQNNNVLEVTIEDNGVGRKKSAEINKNKDEKYKSFSTQANEKRLNILNRYTTHNVSITIFDKYDTEGLPAGTLVKMFIPIN